MRSSSTLLALVLALLTLPVAGLAPAVAVAQTPAVTLPGSEETAARPLPSPPPPVPVRLSDVTGENGDQRVVGLAGQWLEQPLRVQVVDPASGKPLADIAVRFELLRKPDNDGSAGLEPAVAVSNSEGVAQTHLQLGDAPGEYIVTALADGMQGRPPAIIAEARDRGWIFLLFVGLVGGIAIFLFGIQQGSDGLQKVAGSRMRAVLGTLTRNRLVALVVGILLTVTVQSSSATTVMLVGFVNAGLMKLGQSLTVLLGAGIGTTFTVQLIAFKITDYAPLILAAGFLLQALSHVKRNRYIGQAIMGFGFVFFGMQVMASAVGPLRSYPPLAHGLAALGESPILAVVLSTLFTAVVQSSAATIAILLTLTNHDLLTLSGAMPLMFGANVGTCITGVLASMGTKKEAQRVAWAQVLVKVGTVILGLLLLEPFITISAHTAPDIGRQIAWGHTIFNLMMAVTFLPLVTPVARLVERLLPDTPDRAERFGPKYLLPELLGTPGLALENCLREILRMGGYVESMVLDIVPMFKDRDWDAIDRAYALDEHVDRLENDIRGYMSRLAQRELSDEQSVREMALLYLADDLEHVGDVVENDLAPLAQKMIDRDLHFTEEGMQEIEQFHQLVLGVYRKLLTAIRKEDKKIAEQILSDRVRVNRLEKDLRRSHLERINLGIPQSLESGTVHMDLLSGLKRINSYCNKSAMTIIEEF